MHIDKKYMEFNFRVLNDLIVLFFVSIIKRKLKMN